MCPAVDIAREQAATKHTNPTNQSLRACPDTKWQWCCGVSAIVAGGLEVRRSGASMETGLVIAFAVLYQLATPFTPSPFFVVRKDFYVLRVLAHGPR